MRTASLILASTSPRRRDLLALLGVTFEVIPPAANEVRSPALAPGPQAARFALDKARSVAGLHPDALVLGGDTVIEIDGLLLGKPKDRADAAAMLRRLRGREHAVHTGIALVRRAARTSVTHLETARVRFAPFSDRDLERYLEINESLDKAGAYSIQGEGARLIERIEGDYPAIVGLPLRRTAALLAEHGIAVPRDVEDVCRSQTYGWKERWGA